MSRLLILLGFVLLQSLSCEKTQESEVQSANAILKNNIAVDGCEWHMVIPLKDEWAQYATSDGSKSKVDAVIAQANGASGVWSINVKLDYRFTGKKKEVQCGWGKKQSMEEIEVLVITKL